MQNRAQTEVKWNFLTAGTFGRLYFNECSIKHFIFIEIPNGITVVIRILQPI